MTDDTHPQDDHQTPPAATWLGYGGLVPFFLPAIGLWQPALAEFQELLFAVQFAYAAIILSFLGAGALGRALAGNPSSTQQTGRLVWSVTPALFGWVLLIVPIVLPDPRLISFGFALTFTVAYIVDLRAVRAGHFPAWYGTLRKRLTTGVLASFILSLTAGTMLIGG